MDGVREADIDLTYAKKSVFSIDLPYRNGVEFCLRCHNETHQQAGFEMFASFF